MFLMHSGTLSIANRCCDTQNADDSDHKLNINDNL